MLGFRKQILSSGQGGFTVVEILISAAILLVISLGISQLLVSSTRGVNRSDLYITRQSLEKYMTSMAMSESARCNSFKAGGKGWACTVLCEACDAGTAACTGVSGGNCRTGVACGGTGTIAGSPLTTGLKDFSTTTDNRTGGDNKAGLSIVTLLAGGNKVTDGGVPCSGSYASATSTCRWKVAATFQPDYNDAMRFFFTITYQANESDDTQKIPARSWEVVVPMNEVCTSL